MTRAGVRELRQHLSRYLERVKRGERIEVTERGRPVAVLAPLTEADHPLAALEARGLIARRAAGSLADLDPPPFEPGKPQLSVLLAEDRAD